MPPNAGRRGRLVVLLAGGLVLAVLATIGVVYFLNRDSGSDWVAAGESETGDVGGEADGRGNDPSDEPAEPSRPPEPAGPEPWTVAADAWPEWTHAEATWLTDDALIQVTDSYVVAIDRRTGEEVWNSPVPAIGGTDGSNNSGEPDGGIRYCGASTDVVGGLVSLAYGPAGDNDTALCAFVQVLDVASGTEVWTAEAAKPHEFAGDFPRAIMTDIVGDTVVAGWHVNFDAVTVGYDLAAGTERWRTATTEDVFGREACSLDDFVAVDDLALAVGTCSGLDNEFNTELALARLSPADGSVSQTVLTPMTDVGFEFGNLAVLETDPLILRVINSDLTGENGDSMLLIDRSQLIVDAVIAGEQGRALSVAASSDSARLVPAVAVDQDAGWIAALSVDIEGRRSGLDQASLDTQLIAYDLATGEQLWSARPESEILLAPIGVHGGALLAWAGDADGAHRLLEINPANGEITAPSEPVPGAEDFHTGLPGLAPSTRFLPARDWFYAVRTDSGVDSASILAVPR